MSQSLDASCAIVVTTINHPTRAVKAIQQECDRLGCVLHVIGDGKSPSDFTLPGSRYLSLADQRGSDLSFAKLCPPGHYARKNVGYLAAWREGARIIVETDDDNIPVEAFWHDRTLTQTAPVVTAPGWCNVYKHFSDRHIWPRGLPLDAVTAAVPDLSTLRSESAACFVQQGLADGDPDVDAIYRLLLPLPVSFVADRRVILGRGTWCPFNSQNTTWWREAFPLLYLPFYCSFRMTDIWRSFVAQRLLWEIDGRLLFHSSTVFQERNEHNLMRDFADEVPGYLNNDRIRRTLEDLPLMPGPGAIGDNLVKAYAALVDLELVGSGEMKLLDAWLSDAAAF